MIGVQKMPVPFKIKVVQVGKSLKITIPKEICDYLNIRKGDVVAMWTDNGHIVVEKKTGAKKAG